MAQSSGPISQGTTDERQFTDTLWRDRFGDEAGVLSDYDGTAYAITLPADSDVVSIGSASQVSTATVAGFAHRIPAGAPEQLTIPVASGSTRTDIIALRYDPTYTGLPGPVRLVLIAGTSSAIPSYDAAPPGVEDLPLYAITRAVGAPLSQATVVRMFPRIAPVLELPAGAPLPTSSPLGTKLRQNNVEYRRELVSGSPAWVTDERPWIECWLKRSDGANTLNSAANTTLKVYPIPGRSSGTWNTNLSGRGLACALPGIYGISAKLITGGNERYEALSGSGTETLTYLGIPSNTNFGFSAAGGYETVLAPAGLTLFLDAYSSAGSDLRTDGSNNPLSLVKVTYLGHI